MARQQGREIKTLINLHVICRATEKEAWTAYRTILEHEDAEHGRNFVEMFRTGDMGDRRNIHLVGSPEQIVDSFARLKRAGCDGVPGEFLRLHAGP